MGKKVKNKLKEILKEIKLYYLDLWDQLKHPERVR